MKPIFYTICLFLILFVNCKQKPETGTSVAATVVYQSIGEVEYILPDGSKHNFLVSDSLPDETRIKTGSNGKLDLILKTGALLRVLANSEIRLDTKFFSKQDASRNRFQVLKGKLFIQQPTALRKKESLEVITQTQVGGVRGTEFLTQVDGETSQILVSEGAVQTEHIPPVPGEPNAEPPTFNENSPVVTEGNKSEADAETINTSPLTDDEKLLLSDLSTSSAQILQSAKEQIQSIKDQFEKDKERIKIDVEKFKEDNRQILNEQKDKNRAEIETQKEANKQLLNDTKGSTSKTTKDISSGKDEQKSEIQNSSKSQMDAIKEGLKKQ
ncbi:FecR family protein [Leptospira idonii]|nr:FecR family protein [Leptospira idonii]